jgi:hypothetical protein
MCALWQADDDGRLSASGIDIKAVALGVVLEVGSEACG